MLTQKRVWEIVETAGEIDGKRDTQSHLVDVAVLALIFLNVLAVIVDSVEAVNARFGGYFYAFEVFSVAVFTLEYVARLWSCTADDRFRGRWLGRLRCARRPMLIIDLIAFLPFYLPFVGVDLRSVRVLRLFRLLRLAKGARYKRFANALALIKNVLNAKAEEVVLTAALMVMLLVVSSSLLYFCENAVQPDVFSSIPATMWWAVATLTTVGYGDMYPMTIIGRFFAGTFAVLGIGMFALPTAIIGAGFVEEIQKAKGQSKSCPHCGKEIE